MEIGRVSMMVEVARYIAVLLALYIVISVLAAGAEKIGRMIAMAVISA